MVAANGEELDTVEQCDATMSIGNFSPVLVAKGLLGADFLAHDGCVVDTYGQMSVARECVPLRLQQRDIPSHDTCHVDLLENTIVPLHQVKLLVSVQRRASDTIDCDGMVDPSTKFVDHHAGQVYISMHWGSFCYSIVKSYYATCNHVHVSFGQIMIYHVGGLKFITYMFYSFDLYFCR